MNKLMVFSEDKKFDMLHLTYPQPDDVNLSMVMESEYFNVAGCKFEEIEFVGNVKEENKNKFLASFIIFNAG